MKTKSLTFVVVLITLALAACAPKPAPATKPTATSVPPKAVPTATKAPTKVAESTPTKAPTKEVTETPIIPIVNGLSINDQSGANGDILVGLVTAEKAGWVAIFTDSNGQPGTLLGYTAVPAGTTEDVKVTVNPSKVTSKMIAILLVDEGTMGTFEYPGADMAATQSGSNVMAVFNKITG